MSVEKSDAQKESKATPKALPLTVNFTKKRKKWGIIGLSVLGSLFLITLLTLLLTSNNENNTISQIPLPQTYIRNSSNSAELQELTDNWKTYQDDFFSFQMKYPDTWTLATEIDEKSSENNLGTKILSFASPDKTTLTLLLEENPKFTDNEAYLKYERDNYYPNEIMEVVYIDSVMAYLITLDANSQKTIDSITFFLKDGNTYNISLTSPQEIGAQEELLRQVLSTFKFTAPNN